MTFLLWLILPAAILVAIVLMLCFWPVFLAIGLSCLVFHFFGSTAAIITAIICAGVLAGA